MGMRIKTNVESLVGQRQLSNNNAEMNQSLERLSSGLRVNKSADDAAGLAISENLRAKTRGLNQAKRNASDGVSLIQVAEGGLNEVTNIMIRMRELNVQAASDTIGLTEKGYLQKEYSQLGEEIDRIAATTEFNGRMLFGPQTEDTAVKIQVGYNGTAEDTLSLQMGDAPDGINTTTMELKDTVIDSPDREAIAGNLVKIDNAFVNLANSRATLGSMQSRLNTAISSITVSTENMSAAGSRIRDVDFAEESAKLAQTKILTQAGISVLAQANQKPEMALQLLR